MNEKKLPKIGQEVYIPTALYLGHGRDDFRGGLCRIRRIELGKSAGEETVFIEVEENLGTEYNWNLLLKKQKELAKEHGKRRGHPDPDYRPEMNVWE